MGLQVAPGFVSGGGTFQHPVELFRNLVEGIGAGGSKGILTPGSFPMTPSGSLMQLTVGAGYAIISGEESTTQGSYFVWSNASEVLAWPAHPGSNSRWDTLVMRVIDSQYGVDANPDGAMWEICQGTSAPSPTKIPDVEFQSGGDFYRPGAWWRVADVLVQAADLNMAATDITAYLSMVNPYHAREEIGHSLQQTVYFTSGGSFVKANYPLARKLRVRAVGAGGGGGGSGTAAASQSTTAGGGGGGGYAEGWVDVAGLASSVTVTIGTGGTAGVNGASGGNGGTGGASSFGALVAANGGGGGGGGGGSTTTAFGVIGGAYGVGTAGDLILAGNAGESGWKDGQLGIGGNGGSSQLGGGALGTRIGGAGAVVGAVGGNYGGGGSGSVAGNTGSGLAGGIGAQGLVIVEIYG